MKNIFNQSDKDEILMRIEKLSSDSKPLWGKMNAAQMLAHCYRGAQMVTGEIHVKRVPFPISIIGRLLKPSALNESPLRRNTPTAPEFRITDERNFTTEKINLKDALNLISTEGEKSVKAKVHPFFGKLAPNEWGRLTYKHTDHHLQQFGV